MALPVLWLACEVQTDMNRNRVRQKLESVSDSTRNTHPTKNDKHAPHELRLIRTILPPNVFYRKTNGRRRKGVKAGCGRGSNSVHRRLSVKKPGNKSLLVDLPSLRRWRGNQRRTWVALLLRRSALEEAGALN